MNNEEKILSMLEAMQTSVETLQAGQETLQANMEALQTEQEKTNQRLDLIEDTLADVRNRVGRVEHIVLKIENDHGRQLAVLFDGYTQNTAQLERIETVLTRHEEVILRRA